VVNELEAELGRLKAEERVTGAPLKSAAAPDA